MAKSIFTTLAEKIVSCEGIPLAFYLFVFGYFFAKDFIYCIWIYSTTPFPFFFNEAMVSSFTISLSRSREPSKLKIEPTIK